MKPRIYSGEKANELRPRFWLLGLLVAVLIVTAITATLLPPDVGIGVLVAMPVLTPFLTYRVMLSVQRRWDRRHPESVA
jgi:hypothetical protein